MVRLTKFNNNMAKKDAILAIFVNFLVKNKEKLEKI